MRIATQVYADTVGIPHQSCDYVELISKNKGNSSKHVKKTRRKNIVNPLILQKLASEALIHLTIIFEE